MPNRFIKFESHIPGVFFPLSVKIVHCMTERIELLIQYLGLQLSSVKVKKLMRDTSVGSTEDKNLLHYRHIPRNILYDCFSWERFI